MSNSAFFMTTYVLLWVLVLAESLMLFVLLRQIGHVYLSRMPISERDGVSVGKQLPDVPTITPHGTQTLFSLLTTRPYTAVVVVTPTCSVCKEALGALQETAVELPWLGSTVLVEGEVLDGYSGVAVWGSVGMITDKIAGKQLQVRATPFVFIVDSTAQVVSKGIVNTTKDLHRLLEPAKDAIEAIDQDSRTASSGVHST